MKQRLTIETTLMAVTVSLNIGCLLVQGDYPTVRLWDTGKTYTEKGPMGNAWKDKANWVQVPYGKTDYKGSELK